MPSPVQGNKKFLRMNFLIYPRFQFLLIIVNTILIFVSFAITLYAASRTFSRFHAMGNLIRLPPDHPYFKLIEFESNGLYSSLMIAFILAILLTSLTTLLISHRLAGPIVRLRGYFAEIAKTGVVKSGLRFREGDFFEDLPSVVNGALEKLAPVEQRDHDSK